MDVVQALEVEVTVTVVGVTIQEHAALITAGEYGASKGSLYPGPEPFGGVYRGEGSRFFIAFIVDVSVTVLKVRHGKSVCSSAQNEYDFP